MVAGVLTYTCGCSGRNCFDDAAFGRAFGRRETRMQRVHSMLRVVQLPGSSVCDVRRWGRRKQESERVARAFRSVHKIFLTMTAT
jgi:hypothetical protein